MFSYNKAMHIITLMNERSITNLRIFKVFMYIAENPASTSKQISDGTQINSISLRSILLTLKKKGFIRSVDNENDKTKNVLRQQIYFICEDIIEDFEN